MRAFSVGVCVLLAACGGDDDGGAVCEAPGSGVINGTVAGHRIEPVVRAAVVQPIAGIDVVVLDDTAGTCGEVVDTGLHLVLGFPCGTDGPGVYPVAGEQTDCSTLVAFGLIEQNGGMDVASGMTGTVILTRADTCFAGTFEVTFETGETMTGSFSAIRCG